MKAVVVSYIEDKWNVRMPALKKQSENPQYGKLFDDFKEALIYAQGVAKEFHLDLTIEEKDMNLTVELTKEEVQVIEKPINNGEIKVTVSPSEFNSEHWNVSTVIGMEIVYEEFEKFEHAIHYANDLSKRHNRELLILKDRGYATIQVIDELHPIEGKDRIKLAKIQGWYCIVGADYRVGDTVLFFQEGSVIPVSDYFEGLEGFRKRCYQHQYDGYRIQTMKMAGEISQGLVVPISVLPLLLGYNPNTKVIGRDFTTKLRVVKYEGPLGRVIGGTSQSPSIKGDLPDFISRTHEEKLQSCPGVFDCWNKPDGWDVTVKLDGMSFTAYAVIKEDELGGLFIDTGVCSRNWEIQRHEDTKDVTAYFDAYDRYNLETLLLMTCYKLHEDIENSRLDSGSLGKGIYIQGEVVGEGCNHNRMGLKGRDFYIFNVKEFDKTNKSKHTRLSKNILCNIAKENGVELKFVPKIATNLSIPSLSEVEGLMETYKESLKQFVPESNTDMIEGVVLRPYENGEEGYNRRYNQSLSYSFPMSFKYLNREYLNKHKL